MEIQVGEQAMFKNLIQVGEQAMFKNLKQQWVQGEFVAKVEESFIYRIDDDIHISKEYKAIGVKSKINKFHISYYADKTMIYSKGKDVFADNMASALIIFNEEMPNVEPIYIIKSNF